MALRHDVIIVGAGVAGSALAIRLARAGLDVAVVERQSFPRRKVCGECVAASCLHLLDDLGLADIEAGPELREVELAFGGRSVRAPLPAFNAGRHRWGRPIARELLDAALLQRAAAEGANVLQPCRVRGLRGAPGAFECDVERARSDGGRSVAALTLVAPTVVLAHGSWEKSLVPSLPAPVQAGTSLLAFKANFLGARLAPGVLPVLALPGGYGGMVMGAGDEVTLACCIQAGVLRQLRKPQGLSAGAAVERFLRTHCDLVERALDGATRSGAWIGAGPIQPGVRIRPGQPVFLLGNAAGESHPIIGEGISAALQGAWLLADEMIRGRAQIPSGARDLQRRFANGWRRSFGRRVRVAALAASIASRPRTAGGAIGVLSQWPVLLTLMARASGKVHCDVDMAGRQVASDTSQLDHLAK